MVASDLRFVVLGEDQTHMNFVRRWLMAEGVRGHQIRMRYLAVEKSGGAGEAYVRREDAEEVRYYREKANHQRVALIAVIDADVNTVVFRQQQFDDSLDTARRQPGDRIALLVPRRNIETWLMALSDSPSSSAIDETTDFSARFPRGAADACASAGPLLAQFFGRGPDPSDLPSLNAARPEVARLA